MAPTKLKKTTLSTLPRYWHNFSVRNDLVILNGNYSQAHKRYKNNNQQAAANCVVACSFANMLPMASWSKATLNRILDTGSKLHQKSLLDNKCSAHMEPSAINKYFFVDDVKINMAIGIDTSTHRIYRDQQPLNTLRDTMQKFLMVKEYGILGCNQRYWAIWRTEEDFFIFDPLDHNMDGGKWPGIPGQGYCYCRKFNNVAEMAAVLQPLLPDRQIVKITLYPCTVIKLVKINTRPPEELVTKKPPPPLIVTKVPNIGTKVPNIGKKKSEAKLAKTESKPTTSQQQLDVAVVEKKVSASRIPPEKPRVKSVTNFQEVIGGKMGILRASTHQRDPKFSRYLGKQELANAIAALTMLRVHKAKKWVRRILDDILKIGEHIHHDSQHLPVGTITDKVEVYDFAFTPKLERYGTVGRLQSSNDKVLDLLPALANFLLTYDCCVVCGPIIVAVWIEDKMYYMFDPNERDENGRVVLQAPGVACVTWYSTLKDLVAVYFKNLPRSLSQERFVLAKVNIENWRAPLENWANFTALSVNKWILRGNFSQSSKIFEKTSRNIQCTANATMALVFAQLNRVENWDSSTMDEVLINGNEYYLASVLSLQEQNKFQHPLLMVDEVLRTYNVAGKKASLTIDDCLVNGVTNAPDDSSVVNLKRGLLEFFENNTRAVVTCNNLSMATWRDDDTFYYFDSHDRDEVGFKTVFGCSCLIRTTDLNELARIMTNNYGNTRDNLFNISRVEVTLIEANEEGVVLPPLNNYQAINDFVGILRSHWSEASKDKFGLNVNKQTVAMCLTAVALDAVTPAFHWTVEDLDEVLCKGDQLYVESVVATLNDDEEEVEEVLEEGQEAKPRGAITIANVKKTMKIGTNRIEIDVEDLAQGNYQDNLKEAMENLAMKDDGNPEAFRAIFQSKYLTVTMWRDENLFYLFDPKARDEQGQIYGKDDWTLLPPPEPPLEEGEGEEEETEPLDDAVAHDDGDGDIFQVDDDEEEENREREIKDEELEGDDEEVEELVDNVPVALEKKGSAFWQAAQGQNGRSCVLRFSRLDDVIQHLQENAPPTLHEELEFTLKSLTVRNTQELNQVFDPEVNTEKQDDFVGDWYEFKEIDYGKWILRGTKHHKDDLFPKNNRGKQDVPIALTALTFAYLYALSKFKISTIDSILAYGDRLYTTIKRQRTKELKSNKELDLTDEEIQQIIQMTEFHLDAYPMKICIGEKMAMWNLTQDSKISGDIDSINPEDLPDLPTGLANFFNQHIYGFLECKDYPVAVWKLDDIFYMFDPRQLGPNGVQSPIGVACLTRYKNLDDLATVYLLNLPKIGNSAYTIQPITVDKMNCPRQRQPEEKPIKVTKLGGLMMVVPGKDILRGDLKQDYRKFDRGVHVDGAAIAYVALAMSLVQNADTWTKDVVNEVMVLGGELYQASVIKLHMNTWTDRLDIYRVNPDFEIGVVKVNYTLRYMDQRGLVDAKAAKVPNLRQGMERFFQENTHGILLVDKFTLAIWEEELDNNETSIFLFDPNARGVSGLPTPGGVPCLMKFCNAKMASDHVMAALMNVDRAQLPFIIVPVEIVVGQVASRRKKCPEPAPRSVICPSKAAVAEQERTLRKIAEEERKKKEAKKLALIGRQEYHKINNAEFLLRGLRAVKENCALTTNVTAFIIMKISPLDKWSCKQIELVLETGYNLYVDSYVAYKPSDNSKQLTLEMVLRKFAMRELEVEILIYQPVKGDFLIGDRVEKMLSVYFTRQNFGLVLYDGQWVSVYLKGGYFYLFDGYGCDLDGNRRVDGWAVLIRCDDLKTLSKRLVMNLRGWNESVEVKRFFITPIAVKSICKNTKET